jgi:hypothetical protein
VLLQAGRGGLNKPHQQVYPPSTTRLLPVKKLLASEARKTTAAETSRGSPTRAMGVNLSQSLYHSVRAIPILVSSVPMYPGEMELTRTPRFAHSPANDLVSMITPAFEAL